MPLVVETEHKPLLAIMNTPSMVECPPRLMRLKLRMLRYCFTVEYVPSKKLVVADALSRAPIVTDESPRADNPVRVTTTLKHSSVRMASSKESTPYQR